MAQQSATSFVDTIANYTPKYSTLNQVFRETHESRGVDIQTVRRLVVVGDVENLVEAACLLLHRREKLAAIDPKLLPAPPKTLGQGGNLGPSTQPAWAAASPNIMVPGYSETEELCAKYLGINHGYRTQSLDYPGLFFALCCLDHLDVLDFFRIMRSRTDWTSATFRQAWLSSEFRHYKQWVVNNLVHVAPSHYQFYFFSKLIELMFRPVTNPETGEMTYGDVLGTWLTPQVCEVGVEGSNEYEWTFDIFGPFDAKAVQDYVNNLYVRIVDSAFYSANFNALYTLITQPAIPDFLTKPRGFMQSPRATSPSYLPYVTPVLPNIALSKHLVETIFTSRTLLNYFHYRDAKQQINFYSNLAKTSHLETNAKLVELDEERQTHINHIEQLKQTVLAKVAPKTPRAVEIIHQLSTMYADLNAKNAQDGDKPESQQVSADMIALHEELADIKDFTEIFQSDYKESMERIKNITITMEEIELDAESAADRYQALMSSWSIQYNAIWSYLSRFLELFGLDLTLTQDLFALGAYAGLTNDYQLALLLCEHGFQFIVPQPADKAEDDDSFEPLVFTEDVVKEYIANGVPEIPLITPQNVMWDYHHSIHRRQIIRSFKYVSQVKMAADLFTREQNINFLALRLLETNLTSELDLLIKYAHTAKLVIPKQPIEKDEKEEKEEKEDKKKKTVKKGEKKDIASMMQQAMGKLDDSTSKDKAIAAGLTTSQHDDDDDDDFFGASGLTSPVIEHVYLKDIRTPTNTLGEKYQPSTTRKVVSINDLQMGGNYISFVCVCHTARPSTLSYLLSKKAKLYSNSRKEGPPSNAFLQCCVSPLADPKSRAQMLDILFQFIDAAATSAVPYNPVLTYPEFLEILNHQLVKMHANLGTYNLLSPDHHMFTIYNSFNIYYEDRSELLLAARRLIAPAFDPEKGTKILANRGIQQPNVYITNTLQAFRFEYLSNTIDLSVYNPMNHESFIHHHKMHVMISHHLQHQEQLAIQYAEVNDKDNNEYVYVPQQFDQKKYDNFPYHTHPASFTNPKLSIDNAYHGYFGFLDQLDPFQRDFTSPLSRLNKTAQDYLYMKTNPQKNTFLAGYYKDLSVLVTQCFFAQPEHRAQLGSPNMSTIIRPLIRLIISCRCIPLLQWFMNQGYRATPEDLQFLFYSQTNSTFLQDINFEEFFAQHVNRQSMVKGFTNAVQWKRDYIAQGSPKDALDVAQEERERARQEEAKRLEEERITAQKAEKAIAAAKVLEAQPNVDDIDGIDDSHAIAKRQDDLLAEMFGGGGGEETPTSPSTKLVESIMPMTVETATATAKTTLADNASSKKVTAKSAKNGPATTAKKGGLANSIFGQMGAGGPSGKTIQEMQAENEMNSQALAEAQAKQAREDPLLQDLLPLTASDLNSLIKPFSTHLQSGFYPLLKKSKSDSIFAQEYIDPQLVKPGVYRSHLSHQIASSMHFEIDCDYYFTSSHAKSAQALIDFCKQITYDDAKGRYPALVSQIEDIYGTAARYGVPGAVEYDFAYLFKDPAPPKPPQKKPKFPQRKTLVIETEEEYNLIGDYQHAFLIEVLRLWRVLQSYFHQIRSPLYSPTVQCFLTLARSCHKLDDSARHIFAESTWLAGSSLAAYAFSLSRSDPFNDPDFVAPMSVTFSFFMSHMEYATVQRYHKLLKLFTGYLLTDREAHIERKPFLARGYQMSIFLAQNFDMMGQMGNHFMQLQQQLVQAQQMQMMLAAQGGKMPMGMMPPGMGMPDPRQIQQEISQLKIQTVSPIIATYEYMNYFPQFAFKTLVTNPMLPSLFEDKLLSLELYSFYRTANRETDLALTCIAKGVTGTINTSYDAIIHPHYGCPFRIDSISVVNESGDQIIVPLTHALQPLHYIATSIYAIFSQIVRITDMKNQLQHEFQYRAQKCRNEKEMQKLQAEMAQHMQQIETQEQIASKSYLHQTEIDKIAVILDLPFTEEDLISYVSQIGIMSNDPDQVVGMDEKGNRLNAQGKVVVPIGQKGDDADAELVLKQVMASKKAITKGFLSRIFGSSTALILGGVAVAASAAYYAYQFWNNQESKPREDIPQTMLDSSTIEPPPPAVPPPAMLPKAETQSLNNGPFKLKF